MATIATASGEIESSALGRTLMHEHLVIGYPGWQGHAGLPAVSLEDEVAICVDKIAQIQDLGYRTMLDPCPNALALLVEARGADDLEALKGQISELEIELLRMQATRREEAISRLRDRQSL